MSARAKVALLRCRLLVRMGNVRRAVEVLVAAGAALAGAVRYVASLLRPAVIA